MLYVMSLAKLMFLRVFFSTPIILEKNPSFLPWLSFRGLIVQKTWSWIQKALFISPANMCQKTSNVSLINNNFVQMANFLHPLNLQFIKYHFLWF